MMLVSTFGDNVLTKNLESNANVQVILDDGKNNAAEALNKKVWKVH